MPPTSTNGLLFHRYQRIVRLGSDTNKVHVSRECLRHRRRGLVEWTFLLERVTCSLLNLKYNPPSKIEFFIM